MAIRPRRVAILSDCIAFIPIQRRPNAFEQNLSVAKMFHRTSTHCTPPLRVIWEGGEEDRGNRSVHAHRVPMTSDHALTSSGGSDNAKNDVLQWLRLIYAHSNADLGAVLGVSGGLTVERGEPCLSDLYVVLRSIEACADAADDLAIDHDRQPPLHFDIAVRRHCRDAPVIDGILQCLARLFEERVRALPGASSTLATKAALSIRTTRIGHPPSSATAMTPARCCRSASA